MLPAGDGDEPGPGDEVDVRDALIRVDGKDHGVHSPHWISSFTDMTRQAVAYRDGADLYSN
jgi:3-(3-hydroxy-phenyl)propionate hydroxylase